MRPSLSQVLREEEVFEGAASRVLEGLELSVQDPRVVGLSEVEGRGEGVGMGEREMVPGQSEGEAVPDTVGDVREEVEGARETVE